MKINKTIKSLSVLFGITLVAIISFAFSNIQTKSNELSISADNATHYTMHDTKCGTGKCGDGKTVKKDKTTKTKCGDGKTKEVKKTTESKCGDGTTKDKKARKAAKKTETKCGAGKCGK